MKTTYKMTFLFSSILELLVVVFVDDVWMKAFAIVALALIIITIYEEMKR